MATPSDQATWIREVPLYTAWSNDGVMWDSLGGGGGSLAVWGVEQVSIARQLQNLGTELMIPICDYVGLTLSTRKGSPDESAT